MPSLPRALAFAALGFLAGCLADPYAAPPVAASEAADPSARAPDDRYSVIYRGSPGQSAEDVYDRALLRAATVTLQKGGGWFEVVTDYARTATEPRTSFERDPFGQRVAQTADCGLLGCTTSARPEPGVTDIERPENLRPVVTQSLEIIVHYDAMPSNAENAYDAVALSDAVRAKYDREEN